MSIPGLGKIPEKPAASSIRTIRLRPFWEWRFEVPYTSYTSATSEPSTSGPGGASPDPPPGYISVRLLSGTAERDGTELAPPPASYVFAPGTKSKLLSWTGCEIEVRGACDEYTAEYDAPDSSSSGADINANAIALMNLHFKLEGLRSSAAAPPTAPTAPPARRRGPGSQPSSSASRHPGPRLAVVGPPSSGRSTALRTLAAYAVRGGRWQPLVVGADPTGEGVLSLPGTLSAAVCAGVADLEAPAATAGWGRSPSSGPSQVPVRTPVVFYYGRRSIGGIGSGGGVSEKGEDGSSTGAGKGSVATYKRLVARLAAAVSGRLADDEAVRASGLLVDVPAMSGSGGDVQYDILAHIVEELSVNIIVVLESEKLTRDLTRRFENERTSLGEPITVVRIDKSKGVVERDEAYLRQMREAAIKEYFFGDVQRTLSPGTQMADFDSLAIFRFREKSSYYYEFDDTESESLERVTEPTGSMNHWTLAVMHASFHDPLETIMTAAVMGFVYIADVDVSKRKVRYLPPVGGRLGNRPLVWGKWPEPYINLLG